MIVKMGENGTRKFVVGFLRGGGSRGGGNLGNLRIPREDWGTLQNIREDQGNHHLPLRILLVWEKNMFSLMFVSPTCHMRFSAATG